MRSPSASVASASTNMRCAAPRIGTNRDAAITRSVFFFTAAG